MNNIVPVIIIGAGISGIAASSVLFKNGIKHIILQSRNRIGGRILATNFNGDRIQLGASFVHHPQQNNCVAQLMKELSWPTISAEFEKEQSFCEGVGVLSQQVVRKGWAHKDQMLQSIKQEVEKSEKDISITEAASKYISQLDVEEEQRLMVNWGLSMYGCVEGAQTHELSAKQFNFCESEDDFFPVGGYDSFIETIVKKYSPQIILNKRVIKIDYQDSIVKLTTEDGEIYQCEKLISSLPLGVLKKKVVQFHPQLPENKQIAIEKIGNGIADKLFVCVQEPFWGLDKKWINFYASQKNRFSVAYVMITQKQNMLCFFISGKQSQYVSKLSKQNLIKQLTEYFTKFKLQKELKINDVYLTSWHNDNDTLGSYSFYAVGTQKKHFSSLRESIENKVWFIGEHCNEENACVQSAYQTGVWAAEQISKIYGSQ